MWLMKSEPEAYSIDDLARAKTTWWEGVRNYQARNFMQEMKVGDGILFYHSSAEPPGVAGIAKVTKAAAPDESQFDKKSSHFDPKATREKPIWFCVQIQFVKKFPHFLSLQDLRGNAKLAELLVLKKGQRLSVQPVEKKHFDVISKMGGL